MRNPVPPRVFTLTIGGRVVALFKASNRLEVNQLCREPWFREDLRNRKDNRGKPLWDGEAPLQSRPASPDEISDYTLALARAKLEGDHDEDEVFVSFQVGA